MADTRADQALIDAIAGGGVVALTGAGLSTDSGIPDYRGPDSPPRTPMTFQQFIGDPRFRRHYWARNHIGWRHMDSTRPNPGHRALAELERRGIVDGVITQNVDMLHTKAGSRRVVDLHGVYGRVRCLDCENLVSRFELDERLELANPGFAESVVAAQGVEIAPDADATVESTSHFVMVDCERCGGMLKPDIVYFGESVPKPRVQEAYDLVDSARSLLVLGSSLTVMSGLRFVRHAAKIGIDTYIVNRGPTRGDPFAAIKLETGVSELLTELASATTGSTSQAEAARPAR